MTTYTRTVERAIQTAGCGLDDLTADGMSLAEALRTLATAPGYGSDGDYTPAERDLMIRAALEVGEQP